MADFNKAFDKVIKKWEGAILENVAGDLGGQTLYGIARNMNQGWPAWARVDKLLAEGKTNKEVAADPELIQNVIDYWGAEWKAIKCDQIESQKIAEQYYQAYANCGPRVNKWVQTIISEKFHIPLVIDGIIGPKTIATLNGVTESEFVNFFYERQCQYYEAIVKNNPSQKKFLAGWLRRSLDFK